MFTGEGDYQFEVYRQMKEATKNDWSSYCPMTNVFWLDYLALKMVESVYYKRKTSKIHSKAIEKLKCLQQELHKHVDDSLEAFGSAREFVLGMLD